MMKTLCLLVLHFLAAWCLIGSIQAEEFSLHTFESAQLTNTYYSEGANAGDLNGDQIADVVYGPYWFAGPDYKTKHEIYKPVPQDRNRYADNFFSWVYDFNGDGWNDVLTAGFPGTPAYVYENPKKAGQTAHWKKHQVFDWVSNESPQLVNLIGDELPELVCTRDGFFGYVSINKTDPLGTWKFHPISAQITAKRFGHGLGIGDVNGDGRLDVIHAKGWFEQPAAKADASRWTHHPAKLSSGYGGAEMYAYDVDGDGDNDIITSDSAHDFGLSWYEQIREGKNISFKQHQILGSHASQNKYGVLFSEPHSVALADVDGDGLKDIITGKTYWSHHKQSPLWDAGAVVYWFKLVRGKDGVDWVPYRADDQAGIGRQISMVDINADGLLDIVLGGMKGAHVLIHQKKTVTKEVWLAAQPKLYSGPKLPSIKNAKALRGPKSKRDPKTGSVPHAIEGELLKFRKTTGIAKPQSMANFKADKWSNDSQLWWTKAKPGDTLTLQLPEFTGVVDVEVVLTCAGDYGIVQLSLDDQPLGKPIDLFDPQVITTGVLSFPKVAVQGNKHTLKVQITGSHPKAKKAYMFALDYLRIKTGDGKYVAGPKPPKKVVLTPDEYPHAGLSAVDAAKAMQLPKGFSVQVGAAEPDVQQPIAMAIDDRGRVWIAEAYEYPTRAKGDTGRDRILIFEDTDGNGTLDKRKVFAEGLNLVSGLEVGFGGVWVGAAPYLLFIPDKNGDDVPDAKPQILLDGWGYQDTHETLNAFIWGPDGWLYGCHGVFTHSRVGKPGTPDEQRTAINCAVWRYHPIRHEFDVFAHGTSNPWGVDFNDHGQAFITACVIPHLYHIIQGARYQRQGGQHFNPYTYRDIVTIADHLHYLGATPHSGNSKSDAVGGGHAHAGAMIYLGDAWPKQYRNQIFMNNIHGQRLNVDILKPTGSGYVGSHGPDFLLTGDQASQILNLRYGPDGNAWMIDWYDMQACHRRESNVHDRTNGRIYKITYGQAVTNKVVNLAKRSDTELAEFALHQNDWYVRHARRLLQERSEHRKIEPAALATLEKIATTHKDDTRRLRAIWALHVTGNLSANLIQQLLTDQSPYVKGWAIQLAMEAVNNQPKQQLLAQFITLAKTDPSPVVRLYLASAAGRIPLNSRWDLLTALTAYREDANDHNLPLMYWYAAEPLADVDPTRALTLGMSAGEKIPLIRELMLRRIGSSDAASSLALLVNGLGDAKTSELQLIYLKAIRAALLGQRQVKAPAEWAAISKRLLNSEDQNLTLQTLALGVTFGDPKAIAVMRTQAANRSASPDARLLAVQSLLNANDTGVVPTLISLLNAEDSLRETAIKGLAQYDNPSASQSLLNAYPSFTPRQKRLALGTLCSRAGSGVLLLRAIETKTIAGTDLTADLVRQLQYHQHQDINQLLTTVWGTVRESAEDKLALIAEYKTLVESSKHPKPDLELGRAMFAKTCMKCHILYGVGDKIGPDLTGSNRANLDYLLNNIVDPSSVMAKEYRTTLVAINGRVVSGFVKAEDNKTLTLQTADGVVILPKAEIEQRSEGNKSLMPDDQLKKFTPQEIRSLIAYLRAKTQTPLLATSDNATMFFNGKDLNSWSNANGLWTVESGELIGRTNGLKQNQWLVSDLSVQDFRLTVEVKLIDNAGNSGIQFRSHAHEEEVSGYQADIGKGWWGKLYEEHGRGLLGDKSGEPHVKLGQWNQYEIHAQGHRIRTYINGKLCVDLEDQKGAERGIIAFQLHSGGKTEVRFRNMKLEVLESKE